MRPAIDGEVYTYPYENIGIRMASDPALRRRAVLAGGLGTLAATSGCVSELRSIAGRQASEQLSLSISTLPAAEDPYSVRIANHLANHLGRAGVDITVSPMESSQLFQNVLVNLDFDIYVARYPCQGSPDELRSLLYSSYGEEAGWQNPFGFSDLEMDDRLDEQRHLQGDDRKALVGEIQRSVVRNQPFTTVAFPDRIAAVRTDRYRGWPKGGIHRSTDYLQLVRTAETDRLDLLIGNSRVTQNRNPLAVEYRDHGIVTGLLYEPLLRTVDSESIPWLARDIEWQDGDRLTATVTLRETPWHDGEPITAADIAFSYEFLEDTSLGASDTPVPTPWRRGRLSLVDSIRTNSDDEVHVTFTASEIEAAKRGLEVPILPEHIWREQSDSVDIAGIDIAGQTTEALVWPNETPVGSGPVQFSEAGTDSYLILETFPEHFLIEGDTTGIPSRFADGASFERLRLSAVPSDDAAIELLEADDADGTVGSVSGSVVPRIGRNDDIGLTVDHSEAFHHVGYNCRRAPLSNPRFRRAVAKLLDRDYLVEAAFDGYADATETPLGEPWQPSDLEWSGTASLAFPGEEGELDVSAARDAFRDAGYQYEDDQLVRRGSA